MPRRERILQFLQLPRSCSKTPARARVSYPLQPLQFLGYRHWQANLPTSVGKVILEVTPRLLLESITFCKRLAALQKLQHRWAIVSRLRFPWLVTILGISKSPKIS